MGVSPLLLGSRDIGRLYKRWPRERWSVANMSDTEPVTSEFTLVTATADEPQPLPLLSALREWSEWCALHPCGKRTAHYSAHAATFRSTDAITIGSGMLWVSRQKEHRLYARFRPQDLEEQRELGEVRQDMEQDLPRFKHGTCTIWSSLYGLI